MADAPLPSTVEERRRAAKRPVNRAAGFYGHPLHPILVTIPIGAWVISFAFDLASHAADEELVYARGAFWLIGVGIVGAVAAAAAGALDLLNIARGTPAFRTGITHAVINDVVLLAFVVSFVLRRGETSFAATPIGLVVLSALALAGLAVSGWLGGRLAFRYGVRVADESTQDEGFRLPTDRTTDTDTQAEDPA